MSEVNFYLARLGLVGGRRLTDVDPSATCDRNNYWDALRVLLGELSEADFLALAMSIVNNSAELIAANGDEWQCADNYIPVLQGLVCDDYPCSSICAPPLNAAVAEIFDHISSWNQFSFGGPEASA